MSKTKTISIATSWDAVKYKDYIRFFNAIQGSEDDDKLVLDACMQYLFNMNSKDYYGLDTEVFNEITMRVAELIASQQNSPVIKSFTCDGVEYRLDPNLENMSYGQYLDLTEFSKDIWNNMPAIAGILYRPVVHKFNGQYTTKEYSGVTDDTIDLFREKLTMDMCFGIVYGFFLPLMMSCIQDFQTYSIKKSKKELEITLQNPISQRLGESTVALLSLVEEITSKLRK